MTEEAIRSGRQLGEGQRVTSAGLDLLLAVMDTTFDRWVVLNAIASRSLPAQLGLLVPALSAALDATDETVQFMLDDAESAHQVRVVSAPDGDFGDKARVELTAEGEVVHERLRAAIDELTLELSRGVPGRDLETARRVLLESSREARAWLDGDLGVRFSR